MNIEEKIKINFPLKIGFLKKDKEKPLKNLKLLGVNIFSIFIHLNSCL